ncbi:hypothetical protein FSZ31_02985 [Sphingorhabdus soli]|uniref:Uncharacterized protein n=1 Tax=Flavisphingopyxis soli TaxID=2601267 RepID=A0A5C6UKR6_9SPHN|nr:hypothetical protein [Sphingorhabdus soli]TXC73713.1 hypothetical protein FSZ31_02985 [Sphingorhabdus soli]
MDTLEFPGDDDERAAMRARLRAAPSPAKRGGMALTLLALMLFASPQLTGRSEIGGLDTATLGWIALAAGWVLLIAGIIIRARRFRALAGPKT